jgi:sporulation protein YlmC with PRC-barrel domain
MSQKDWKREELTGKPVIDKDAKIIGYVKDLNITLTTKQNPAQEKEKAKISLTITKTLTDQTELGSLPIQLVETIGDVILLKLKIEPKIFQPEA